MSFQWKKEFYWMIEISFWRRNLNKNIRIVCNAFRYAGSTELVISISISIFQFQAVFLYWFVSYYFVLGLDTASYDIIIRPLSSYYVLQIHTLFSEELYTLTQYYILWNLFIGSIKKYNILWVLVGCYEIVFWPVKEYCRLFNLSYILWNNILSYELILGTL